MGYYGPGSQDQSLALLKGFIPSGLGSSFPREETGAEDGLACIPVQNSILQAQHNNRR